MRRDIEELLHTGGDERLDILHNGLNKYYLNPHQYKNYLHRGSCTCNTLNEITHERIVKVFEDTSVDYVKIREGQTQRIKKIMNYEGRDEFDVIYTSSGSDLPYIPLIFSKLLHSEKDIKLLLTCPEELGSGTQIAFLGKYFGAKNQFGEIQEKGENINSHYSISIDKFAARSNEGKILNHVEEIKRTIKENQKYALIGALVIGSKSGIEDDISLIPEIDPNVMWVVDLCQFRNSKKLVNELLSKNCMVMITGSKFYMSPPFSGAMLIPKQLSKKISGLKINKNILRGYTDIFSYYDFPKELGKVRELFRKEINKGLILRWEAALSMMNKFDNLPMAEVNFIIKDWNGFVKSGIEKSTNLELMPQQDKTNKTIISFKILNQHGEYLDYTALKAFHKKLVTSPFISGRFKKIHIGQPVKYGYGAFLRVALGAYNIINLMELHKSKRYVADQDLIHHINQMALKK